MRKIDEVKLRTAVREAFAGLIKEDFDELSGQDSDDGLYYDINGLAPKIMDWHSGQGSSAYSLGSTWTAGKGATKEMMQKAYDELDQDYFSNEEEDWKEMFGDEGVENKKELEDLLVQLDYQINPN